MGFWVVMLQHYRGHLWVANFFRAILWMMLTHLKGAVNPFSKRFGRDTHFEQAGEDTLEGLVGSTGFSTVV